jgi:hypothetical protein
VINLLFIIFWTLMIFLSVTWYGFLLFYIGYKGGREIGQMVRNFKSRPPPDSEP